MPRDRDGEKLRPGDIVHVPCVVTGIDNQPEYMNVALETVEPMYPGNTKLALILNARQVVLHEQLGESDPNMDVKAAIEQKLESDSKIVSHGEIVKDR